LPHVWVTEITKKSAAPGGATLNWGEGVVMTGRRRDENVEVRQFDVEGLNKNQKEGRKETVDTLFGVWAGLNAPNRWTGCRTNQSKRHYDNLREAVVWD